MRLHFDDLQVSPVLILWKDICARRPGRRVNGRNADLPLMNGSQIVYSVVCVLNGEIVARRLDTFDLTSGRETVLAAYTRAVGVVWDILATATLALGCSY